MPHAIAWCGFLGAWLLVAGPIYQAALELAGEEFERSDLERARDLTPAPPPVSRWWLLLPPVAFLLHRRRHHQQRDALMDVLTRAQLEQLMHFSEVATAWLFVACGASLIAVKETWELHETYEWSVGVFVALVVVMIIVCAANTALRVQRREDILARGSTPPQEPARGR